MESKSSSASEEESTSQPRRNRSNLRRYSSNPDLSSPEYFISDPFTVIESQSSSSSRETGTSLPSNRPTFDPGFRSRDPFRTRQPFIESGRYLSSPELAWYSSSSTIWTPDKEYRFTPPFPIASDFRSSSASTGTSSNPTNNKWANMQYDLGEYAIPATFPPWEVPRRKDEYAISSSTSTDTNSNLPSKERTDMQYGIDCNAPLEYLASAQFRTVESLSSSTCKKTRTNLPSKKSVTSEYKMVAKALVGYSTSNATTVTESQSSSRKTSTGLSSDKSVSLNLEIESGSSSQVEPSASDIRDAALPRRSFCKRLKKQKKLWLEHIKLYFPLFLIVASLQVLSFIFVMLRLFSPIGDPISFTITAGCLFSISFAFFRATVPEGPKFLASPIADDDTDEEENAITSS